MLEKEWPYEPGGLIHGPGNLSDILIDVGECVCREVSEGIWACGRFDPLHAMLHLYWWHGWWN